MREKIKMLESRWMWILIYNCTISRKHRPRAVVLFSSELRAASKRKIMLINGKKTGEIFSFPGLQPSFLAASPLAPHACSRSTVIQKTNKRLLSVSGKTKLEIVLQWRNSTLGTRGFFSRAEIFQGRPRLKSAKGATWALFRRAKASAKRARSARQARRGKAQNGGGAQTILACVQTITKLWLEFNFVCAQAKTIPTGGKAFRAGHWK